MPIIRRADVPVSSGTIYPPPMNEGMGKHHWWSLSDAAGLTQFGAALEELPPGAQSSHRHWHENEDEFLYVLAGEVTLVEDDGEHLLGPGDAVGWKAGDQNGHTLRNHSDQPARYIIVGTRAERDVCHYSDVDMLYTRDEDGTRFTRRDGSPI